MKNDFNAMIFLLQYSDTDDFLFIPIAKIYQKNGRVQASILVSIEENHEFYDYCVGLVYEKYNSKKGNFAILDEIENLSYKTNNTKPDASCFSPIFCKYHNRRNYKINIKNIPYFGEGKYAVVLLKGTRKELENDIQTDVNIVHEKLLSNVCFEVVPE